MYREKKESAESDMDAILAYALQNDIIDIKSIEKMCKDMRRKEILAQHKYSIWMNEYSLWVTHVRDKDGKLVLRRRKTRKELEDYLVKFYSGKITGYYICDVFWEWIKEKYEFNEIQKQSYDKYCTEFIRFFSADHPICNKPMKDITEMELEYFIKESIRDHKLSRKTFACLRILLNGIFKYGKKHGHTEISITSFMGDLQLPKTMFQKNNKPRSREVFNEDEIILVTDYLKRNPDIWNLGLLLQFQTGMRIGEIAALKWGDIFPDYIFVHRSEKKYKGEDGKWVCEPKDTPKTDAGFRDLILPPTAKDTMKAVSALTRNAEYVFSNNGKRIRENTFNKRLDTVCRTLQIPVRSTHKIRKTYGTTLLDNNVNDSVVAEQMGHADIATTRKLYYFSNRSQKEKMKQVENAIKF